MPAPNSRDILLLCTCGAEHFVTEGAADSTIPCPCGKEVKVPRLSELRRIAGRSGSLSPDLQLELLLAEGRIDLGRVCTLCAEETSKTAIVSVECERSWVKRGEGGFWSQLFSYFLLGGLGVLLVRLNRTPDRRFGNDKVYHLPLRVCERCRPRLKDKIVARDCLMQVPIYGDLLDKFPNAVISLS